MRKINILIMICVMATGLVMAQAPQRGERRQMDSKTRAERRTEHMVTQYGLNDTQKAKLLELNLAEAEKMESRKDNQTTEIKQERDAYEAKLKEIFTEEQYKKHQINQAERQKRGNAQGGGRNRNNR